MKLTTKSRYAINALTELSNLSSNGPVAIKDIANRQNIEVTYLEQLFRKLRIAGIVKSIRGCGQFIFDNFTQNVNSIIDPLNNFVYIGLPNQNFLGLHYICKIVLHFPYIYEL